MKLKNIHVSLLTLSIAGILSLSFLEGVYAVKVGLDAERTPAKNPEDKYLTEVREKSAEFGADIDIRHVRQEVIAVDRNQKGKEIARLDSKGKKFETSDWAGLYAGTSVLGAKEGGRSYNIEIYAENRETRPEEVVVFKRNGFQQNSDKSWNSELLLTDLKKFETELLHAHYDKNSDTKADPNMKFVFLDLDHVSVGALKGVFDNGRFSQHYGWGKYMEVVPALKSYAEITAEARAKADGVYDFKEGQILYKRGQNVTIMDSKRKIMWLTNPVEASGFQDLLKGKGIDYVVFSADFNPFAPRGNEILSGGEGRTVAPVVLESRWDFVSPNADSGTIDKSSFFKFSDENYERAREFYGQLPEGVVDEKWKVASRFQSLNTKS